MPVISSAIVASVANHILKESIKEAAYGGIKWFFHKLLFPKTKYENEIKDTIVKTVTEYRTKNPTSDGKVAFYELEEVYNYLNAYIYFGNGKAQKIDDFFNKYPNLEIPTVEQLKQFFDYFYDNVEKNKKLKKLYIGQNYQEHIFKIGQQLTTIEEKLDRLEHSLNFSHTLNIDPYVERDNEQELFNKLDENSVLLLTGMSFCGKTQLAKFLCKRYVEKGFNFLEYNNIDTCIDKLKRSGSQPTIILLDDPFGHVEKNGNSQNDWAKLVNFIRTFPKMHKLVVCSRIDIVYSVNNDDRLVHCNMGEHNWKDLTVKDPEFILRYWNNASLNRLPNQDFKDRFGKYIHANFEQVKLQPGQLDYLIHNPFDDIKDKSNEELIRLAQTDSKQISDVIYNDPYLKKIYIALGLCCDTIDFVSFKELAYVLSSNEDLIGYTKENDDILSHKFSNERSPKFPVYPSEIKLKESDLRCLSELKIRGYIEIQNEQIRFRHPTYQYVSTVLMLRENPDIDSLIKNMLPRAFSTLNSKNAIIASRQSVFLNARKNDSYRSFFRIAFLEAINRTIFPKVKESFIADVLQILEDLSKEDYNHILSIIHSGVSTSNIFWSEDVPFFDEENWNIFDSLFVSNLDANLDDRIARLNDGNELKTKELWGFVEAIGNSEFLTLTTKGIQTMLNCEEIFIRAEIVNKIFKYDFPDNTLVERIFSDVHPAVIVEAIKGVFEGYRKYSTERQSFILDRVKIAMIDPIVNLRGESFFSTIGLGYPSESLDFDSLTELDAASIWKLWGDVFPLFLNNFPKNRTLSDSARFSSNLTESFKYITENQRLEIADSLYNWIDIRLKNKMPLDTYELSVIHCLFENNKKLNDGRGTLIRKCLSHWHTGFAALSFSSVFWYWELLSSNEIAIILECLDQDRPDCRWFRAIAITSRAIPAEIQERLLGSATYFNEEIRTIVERMPVQLLSDALEILTGKLWPFSFYGLARTNCEVWQRIKEYIIIHEVDPKFSICLNDMLWKFLSSGEHNSGYINQIESIWKDLCTKSDDRNKLLNILIHSTVEVNYSIVPTKKLYEIILDSYGDNVKEAYLFLGKYADAIQQHDRDGSDFFEIMRKHLMQLIQSELFKTDKKIINLYLKLNSPDFPENIILAEEIEEILNSVKATPIKFKYLPIILEIMMERFPDYADILSNLKVIRYTGNDAGKKLKESLTANETAENWYEEFVT